MIRARAAALVLALALVACASPMRIEPEALPPEPIAVTYYTPDQARRRAERARAATEQSRRSATGIVYLGDLSEWDRDWSSSHDGLGRLALVLPREGRAQPLDGLPRGATPQAWSADRRRLLFSAPWQGDVQLFAVDLDGGEVRRLTSGPDAHPMGCWLPDGRLVAVARSGRGARMRARLVVEAGPALRWAPLSDGPADVSPTCAPDRPLVAFVVLGASGVASIRVADLAAGTLSRPLAAGEAPRFSPDGAWIVYSGRSSQGLRLRRMRPDGSGKLSVGRAGRGDEREPTVSPDGRFVAYVLVEDGREWLRVRRLDGSGDRPLLEEGAATRPIW